MAKYYSSNGGQSNCFRAWSWRIATFWEAVIADAGGSINGHS